MRAGCGLAAAVHRPSPTSCRHQLCWGLWLLDDEKNLLLLGTMLLLLLPPSLLPPFSVYGGRRCHCWPCHLQALLRALGLDCRQLVLALLRLKLTGQSCYLPSRSCWRPRGGRCQCLGNTMPATCCSLRDAEWTDPVVLQAGRQAGKTAGLCKQGSLLLTHSSSDFCTNTCTLLQ
jgi:hypothetical protein